MYVLLKALGHVSAVATNYKGLYLYHHYYMQTMTTITTAVVAVGNLQVCRTAMVVQYCFQQYSSSTSIDSSGSVSVRSIVVWYWGGALQCNSYKVIPFLIGTRLFGNPSPSLDCIHQKMWGMMCMCCLRFELDIFPCRATFLGCN